MGAAEVTMRSARNDAARAAWLVGLVCLGGTGAEVAWADPARPGPLEDPYQPHHVDGQVARLGTAVGLVHGDRFSAEALGATVAWGRRVERWTVEAELAHLGYSDLGPVPYALGRGERVAVVARAELLRLGPRWLGPNSMLALYVEGGAGRAWDHWYHPSATDPQRIVPADTARVEGLGGFGLLLDHRLMRPRGFSRIGWFLGWRFEVAPHQPDAARVCRGTVCRTAEPAAPSDARVDRRGALLQSSMAITW